MKRALCLLLALCLAVSLIACGHEHSWIEASCTQPRTCSACGATEGEPLGHDWIPAGCLEPKTCARCGETEGEPLGHTVVEADYWHGSYCSLCGEQFSEPLEPAFAEHGLDAFLHPVGTGEKFSYVTCGWKDGDRLPEYDAAADVSVYAGKLQDEDGQDLGDNWVYPGDHVFLHTADAELVGLIRKVEAFEGDDYEWIGLYAVVQYTSYKHGYSTAACEEDYYDIVGHDETSEDLESAEGKYVLGAYSVKYRDETRKVYIIDYDREGSGGNGLACFEKYFYVPKGYDGCVFGLYDGALVPDYDWAEGTYIYDYQNENLLLFRLKADPD